MLGDYYQAILKFNDVRQTAPEERPRAGGGAQDRPTRFADGQQDRGATRVSEGGEGLPSPRPRRSEAGREARRALGAVARAVEVVRAHRLAPAAVRRAGPDPRQFRRRPPRSPGDLGRVGGSPTRARRRRRRRDHLQPHPIAVLRPERAPAAAHVARAIGCAPRRDRRSTSLVLQRFTRAFAELDGRGVRRATSSSARLRAAHVVVGHSVSFGRERRGTRRCSQGSAARLGFARRGVGPVAVDGHEVSSTAVRRAIAAGDVRARDDAARAAAPARRSRRRGQASRRDARLSDRERPLRAGMFPPDGVYAVTRAIAR